MKLWVDASGTSQERIFDVAASDAREPVSGTDRVPSLESTVDVENASYTNTIGAVRLAAVWQDPDFEPRSPARYYARVLEIATPRWSTYDAKALGIPAPAPVEIQERAVSSAITYSP